MIAALTLFTLLWAMSCTGLYFLMLRKYQQAEAAWNQAKKEQERAEKNWQASFDFRKEAAQERLEAYRPKEEARRQNDELANYYKHYYLFDN